MRLLRCVLALAGLTAVVAIEAPAIQMDVKAGETRCLSDSVRAEERTIFEYSAIVRSKGEVLSKVKVTLRDPDGKQHHADLTEFPEQFVIEKGGGGGTCRVCFQNIGQKGTTTRVELVETTVLSEVGPRPKTAPHMRPVELLLHHAKEVSKSLKQQLSEGADLETERTLNQNVQRSRINKVAAFTILVLLSVSGWQLALLNKFFRSKKLI